MQSRGWAVAAGRWGRTEELGSERSFLRVLNQPGQCGLSVHSLSRQGKWNNI